ncbi:MAG: carboxymuconolactone decarboxylase family protein [Hyphomicrobiales bacterium]|nr:carboxymuconolactone decarboxylase family protein [Hyphomicrobiales bacterium]
MSQTAAFPRLDIEAFRVAAPEAYEALGALSRAVDATGLDKGLTELVKLRVSQINGCAFCVGFHLALARRVGVAQEKLDFVAVWREAGVFSPRETAALAWAERLTAMATAPFGDDASAALLSVFSPDEVIPLTVAIANINAWNRIAGGLAFPPPRASVR